MLRKIYGMGDNMEFLSYGVVCSVAVRDEDVCWKDKVIHKSYM